jgi:hypothetical protein
MALAQPMNGEWVGLDQRLHRTLVCSLHKPKSAYRVLAWLVSKRPANEYHVLVLVQPINVRLQMLAANVSPLGSIMKAHREQHTFNLGDDRRTSEKCAQRTDALVRHRRLTS